MDIRSWLASLGLDRFADTFEKNEIDLKVLATLTESDLEKMGIDALGARRKLITAIATLNAGGSAPSSSPAPPSSTSPPAVPAFALQGTYVAPAAPAPAPSPVVVPGLSRGQQALVVDGTFVGG